MKPLNYLSHNWLALKINNRIVLAKLPIMRGRVVDLGCGTAPYKAEILRRADEYIGVDWRDGFHDQRNVDLFANLAEVLPIESDFADTVTAFEVMEHLPEPGLFLSECRRILRPSGSLILTVPFNWHVHEAPHDYYRYTPYGLAHLLKKAGFEDIRIENKTGFWQMWALKFNYHTHGSTRGRLKFLAPALIPVWWLAQVLSPTLDRVDPHPEESGGYIVVARKPAAAADGA